MSYTRLRYHVIFATKGRRPYFTSEVESFVYEQLRSEALALDSKIMLLGGVEDHIHSITAIHPSVAVSDYARDVKKQTTKAIRDEFPYLGGFEWCVGFTAYTVNPDDMSELWGYIKTQKEHHAQNTLIAKFEHTANPKDRPAEDQTVTGGKRVEAPSGALDVRTLGEGHRSTPPHTEDPRQADPHTEDPRQADPHTEDPRQADPHTEDPRQADPHGEGHRSTPPHHEQPRKAQPSTNVATRY